MIDEKLKIIELLAEQAREVIVNLRREVSLLKEANRELRSENYAKAIRISELEEEVQQLQFIGKNNFYSFNNIKQQGTEGVAHVPSTHAVAPSRSRTEDIEAEKPQKTVRKTRKARSIDLLTTQTVDIEVGYESKQLA